MPDVLMYNEKKQHQTTSGSDRGVAMSSSQVRHSPDLDSDWSMPEVCMGCIGVMCIYRYI